MTLMFSKMPARGLIALLHDLVMTAISFNVALYLRLGNDISQHIEVVTIGTPIIVGLAAVLFYIMGLYKGIWRYASIRDLIAITKSASLLILTFALLMFIITRLEDFPRSAPLINWFVLMALLGGPRFIYRMIKDQRVDLSNLVSETRAIPSLLVGAGDGTELFLRALDRNTTIPYRPVGIVAEKKSRLGLNIHGISVVGQVDDLKEIIIQLEKEDKRPQRLILTKDDWPGEKVRELYDISEEVGIPLSRLPKLTDLKSSAIDNIDVRPIDVEDLLGRPQKALDKSLPRSLVAGQRILITGAGGSIGSELVRQICSFNPKEIILLEASEYALYTIDLEIQRAFPDVKRKAIICNIRNKGRLEDIFDTAQPDLVFHAAALKHVPLVEANIMEGIETNIYGTKNVADACAKFGVKAMVQISTDKAVNPTNVMGTTKRIAEQYAQALDLADDENNSCRYITVRFGNVLGSTGSVVPLFQKQLLAGGPLTVTHPDMLRYFMTIREAVELVLQAVVMARKDKNLIGKICVLDMGKPVKILHLAEQMIRLANLEPYKDISIEITGLRPGEKLYEEIFHGEEAPLPSDVEGIMIAQARTKNLSELRKLLSELADSSSLNSHELKEKLTIFVPEFTHETLH